MAGPVFLSGDHVTLRTVEEEDLDAFARARSDPDVRIPLSIDTPQNRDGFEEFFEETISDDEGYWFVASVDEETVGAVMFPEVRESAGLGEMAYWILPEYQGEGYGREAVSLLLEYGFDELRLHRAQAACLSTNEASRALLESLGFELEGEFRDAAFQGGRHIDVLHFGLLAEEWRDR